ncbi:cryptococcal mannosyltransferase 1-domain-containing protein, partial [Thelonectria olida]
MRRKLVLLLFPALCFFLIAATLFLGGDHLNRLSNLHLPFHHEAAPSIRPSEPVSNPTTTITTTTTTATSTTIPTTTTTTTTSTSAEQTTASSTPSISNGTILSAERIAPYVSAILDPAATELPRLECPALDTGRYNVLRNALDDPNNIDFFFALNLRECVQLLPRLLGSIVEAIRFLGPHRCALSIVEGNSPDGTADVLAALGPFLDEIGVTYFYNNSDINPAKGARIKLLAELRNLALEPLFEKRAAVTEDTTVLFINDVAACTEDLLELLLQRRNLGADMTCAMDWTYLGPDPTFYDIWISRTIKGDSFFKIDTGKWDAAGNLFWNDAQTKSRFESHLPFQVFACWNGATTFTAAPLLHGLRFRDVYGDRGECFQGEPELFCKDMWFKGYRKIAVVPTVNLEYSDERGADIKKLKGYASELVKNQDEDSSKIEWAFDAPEKV